MSDKFEFYGNEKLPNFPRNIDCKCDGEKVTITRMQSVVDGSDLVKITGRPVEDEMRRLLNAEIEMFQADNDKLKEQNEQLIKALKGCMDVIENHINYSMRNETIFKTGIEINCPPLDKAKALLLILEKESDCE